MDIKETLEKASERRLELADMLARNAFSDTPLDSAAKELRTADAQIREMAEALDELLDAFESFMREANWGASALSADTIRKANEAPGKARNALSTEKHHD